MRSLWKGAINFGLINIPVSLYTATQDHELKFTLLHKKDLSEIRYARICKTEEKEVPYSDIVKGYEKDGHYVVLSDEDFEKAEPEKVRTIDIVAFTDESEIESVYYEKPYFLKPEKHGEKAYALLIEGLKKSKKVGIARYVFKNHEHLAAIKPYNNVLILNQMRFHNQIVQSKSLEIPHVKVTAKEIEMAIQLINQLTEPFKPDQYHDEYIEDLQKIIQKKSKGKKIEPKEKTTKAPSKVYDIMSLLKASLDEKKKPKKTPAKRKISR